MLKVTRKPGEKVFVKNNDGETIFTVEVIHVLEDKVKIGIAAPQDLILHRDDIKNTEPKHKTKEPK